MAYLYRLTPELWDRRGPCGTPLVVYAVDPAGVAPAGPLRAWAVCSPRVDGDPASTWSGSRTFYRLRMPPEAWGEGGSCCSREEGDAVTHQTLPVFLSWALRNGYTLLPGTDLSALRPGLSLWLQGPAPTLPDGS